MENKGATPANGFCPQQRTSPRWNRGWIALAMTAIGLTGAPCAADDNHRRGRLLPQAAAACRRNRCRRTGKYSETRAASGSARTGPAFAPSSLQFFDTDQRAHVRQHLPYRRAPPGIAREEDMSSIGGVSNLNYDSFLISGNSNVKKPDQNYLASQANAVNEASKTAKTTGSSATEEFRKYMQMTPAEKIRHGVLSELGITEDQLAAMPPEQREATEKKIAELIAMRTGGNEGNAQAIQQAQSPFGAGLFNLVQAGSRVAMPLVDVFS
jgi:hypothetical protein